MYAVSLYICIVCMLIPGCGKKTKNNQKLRKSGFPTSEQLKQCDGTEHKEKIIIWN